MTPLAFLNLGLPEMLMIGAALLLFFGPGLARTVGRLGGTALKLKKEVDGAKSSLQKRLTQELDSVVRGPKTPAEPKEDAQPASEGPRAS